MCGITGLVYHDHGRKVVFDDIQRMCRTLTHRGPDDEGYFVDQNIGIGMRRLQVIDLVSGHQPITNETQDVWIVFNGEIYNHQELRKELESQGHTFSTNTDTEAIIHAYEEYGEDCVGKLNGMFAFAIWDASKDKLFLARDRVGVKPLYYYVDKDCLIFGSELKAILACQHVQKEIDLQSLDLFLTYEYVPAPRSIFKSIKKLLPGHVLVLKHGNVNISQYWNIRYGGRQACEWDADQTLYDLIKDAVRVRLISDVPLGAFLSGGIDSSAIVCMMTELMDKPVKTFSIGFDDPSYNELRYARRIAQHFQTDHYELTIHPDVVKLVEKLVWFLDEPLADVSIFPTYLLSHLTREHVTVALSGDGGDELFAGYDWYVADRVERYYRFLPHWIRRTAFPHMLSMIPPSSKKKGILNKAKRFAEGANQKRELQHFRWNMFLNAEKKSQLYAEGFEHSSRPDLHDLDHEDYLNQFEGADPLWQQQFADVKTFLADDILPKVDRMSMANSLEARTPFLDYRVVELAFRIPSEHKLKRLQTKYILKQCLSKKLPKDILFRKKEGFSIPMKNWLRQELVPMMQDVLSPERLKKEGFFNPDYVEKMKMQHIQGSANFSHELWSLMMFEIWRDQFSC